MKISVVIPAYNEERLLPASLASIRDALPAFDAAGWASELIVCDNNSTDRTAQIAATAGALVVFEPVNQIARARNAGAARATGDWLLFVDADSFPTRELFADVALAIHSGRCLAGGATIRFDPALGALNVFVVWWNAISRAAKWGAGSFIFCDTEAFRQIGGFSHSLYAAEEIDLFRRLKRVARRARRRIVILHRHPLRTSGRKADLYSMREMLVFWMRTVASGGRTLRSAKESFVWYDGRR